MKRISTRLLSVTMAILISFLMACGGGGDDIRVDTNGIIQEAQIGEAFCDAGLPSGTGMAGFGGAVLSPLYCVITFRLDRFAVDQFEFIVADVGEAYRQRNQPLVMGGDLVQGIISLQGQQQTIYDGVISFSKISNWAGDEVCGQFEFAAGFSRIEGSFCTNVRSGF